MSIVCILEKLNLEVQTYGLLILLRDRAEVVTKYELRNHLSVVTCLFAPNFCSVGVIRWWACE